jgi:hypothetical protein
MSYARTAPSDPITDIGFETSPLTVTDGLDARSRAVPRRFRLSLEESAAGRYDCQVTVLDATGQKAAFWRAAVVVIR